MNEVTLILSKIEAGDPTATRDLLPLVYEELRKLAAARMAAERPDHTLQATALVHEAYLRIVHSEVELHWDSRGHFFAAAAEAMRRILVNWAEAKRTAKRGGRARRVAMEELAASTMWDADLILDLDEGLGQLAGIDETAAELVKLRLLGGLSVTEAGEVLKLSRTEAYENWKFARAWFGAHQAAANR